MFLEKYTNRGNVYIKVSENHKYVKDGKIKYKKKMIKSLGNINKLDNGDPDFFKKLRDNFQKGIALIPELNEFIDVDKIPINFSMLPNQTYSSKNVGYLILNNIFNKLGISHILTKEKSRKNINYDLLGLVRLLVFTRFLKPNSKIKSFEQKDDFLFDVTTSTDYHEIYKALDILNKKSETIINVINNNIEKNIGRDASLTYYDVTNYYFEINKSDEDIENKKGLRKIGVSKENRKNPIIQMGMFLDKNSIPISYSLFPGNILDTQTMKPAMKKYIDKYKLKNILVVADRGMMSGNNEIHVLNNGNDYLFAKSVRKSKKEIKDWVLKQENYVSNKNNTFKSKSQIVETNTKDEHGVVHTIKEKLLVYWSKDFYDRELIEKQKFLEILEKYTKNPASIPQHRKRGIEKYIIKTQVDKNTGEVINSTEIRQIDIKKFEKEKELMGYYILSTSKLDMPDNEMLSTYKGLTKIENCFRILKSNFETRPVYVRTEEHINAHFLICFIALTIMRIIQKKVADEVKENNKINIWSDGLSSEKIQEALNNFRCITLDNYCIFKEIKNKEDLELLLKALKMEVDFKIQKEDKLKKSLIS